jgi:hypothetical protein
MLSNQKKVLIWSKVCKIIFFLKENLSKKIFQPIFKLFHFWQFDEKKLFPMQKSKENQKDLFKTGFHSKLKNSVKF